MNSISHKTIPFVANHKDNIHCVNAVFRMVHHYFFGKDLSWKKIDTLTKTISEKATWTFIGEMEFAKKGLNVLNIEPVDYKKLYEEGIGYLKKVVGEETANYYRDKSNITSVLRYIPEYLQCVRHETRRASIKEIIRFLKTGCLVGAEVNSGILNRKAGFDLHFVLLYDVVGKHIILHDPGLPPIQSRKVTIKEFENCFHYPGANGGITVFCREK